MSRPNILFVTTDQQRYDALGCNGNDIIRTPTVDGIAAEGVRYERAHTQNVLCTPSRVTMATGQHPGTHRVWCNGVALPHESQTVTHVLKEAGYATALLGKIHYEPGVTMTAHLKEIGADRAWTGPHRGFDHIETGGHFPFAGHYSRWLRRQLGDAGFKEYGDAVWECFKGFGGDTGAPQAMYADLDAKLSFSSWVVDRTIAWLDTKPADQPFFAWVSFDDPHHPFKPPAEYGRRHDWRSLPLPAARPSTREAIEAELASKPWQYGAYFRGEYDTHEGSLGDRPGDLTDDHVRELTALTYGMVELIDDELGRLVGDLKRRGQWDNTHVFFTTDHGELLGDHGLLFKGPFHVSSLLRLPFVWRSPGGPQGATVTDPVGLVDLAPTFCAIAGLEVPEWMDGSPLPARDGSRERVLTVFDSSYDKSLALRTMYRGGWIVTHYPEIDGVGELYDTVDDPHEQQNRWDDPSLRSLRDDLVADLLDHTIEDPNPERLPWWDHA